MWRPTRATTPRPTSSAARCSRTRPRERRLPSTTPASGASRFGPNDTGPLPHWTDPPTGEIPRLAPPPPAGDDDRRRGRRVVDVHHRVAGVARRRRRRTRPASQPVDIDRRPDRRGATPTASSEPIVAPADGRDPDRRAAAPRARPHHDRHRPVGHAPSPHRSRPPRRAPHPAQRASGRPGAHAVAPPPRNLPCGAHRRRRAGRRVHRRAVASSRCWSLIITSCWPSPASSTSARSPRRGTGRRSPPGLAACVAAPLAAYWVGERGAAARDRVRLHGRRRSASSAPVASSPARCRTWPSPRWASCGSACSVRSPR